MAGSAITGGDQEGGTIFNGGRRRGSRRGSRRHGSRRHGKRRGYRGGCGNGSGGVATNALAWTTMAPLEGMLSPPGGGEGMSNGGATEGLYGGTNQTGGHRCSTRHKRGKRTRRHAGRKSRKNKSRRYGLSLNRILGRS